ncbi:MAG TPA: hypothetical protein VLB44_03645, partial [Kofleriaceae bacterium]|nr:hypothetical protein [Kofleriaceae bacterium]
VTELHYMIHAELTGAGPYDGSSGLLTGSITYTPQALADATFHAKLTSLTHPDLPPIDDTISLASNMVVTDEYLDFQLWDGCAAAACSEDFELTITRDATVDLPAIDVGGTVHVDVTGNKSKAPAGTALTVEVTPIP